MTNKQADEIISNYKPHKGFFDLSTKPDNLTKMEYAIILDTQNLLAESAERFKTVDKSLNSTSWNQALNLSAQLQQIIFRHWGLGVLEQ